MDSNWGQIADKRINKYINLEGINNFEDYKKAVYEYLYFNSDRDKRRTGRNIINSKRRSFNNIVEEMWSNSKLTKERQQKLEEYDLIRKQMKVLSQAKEKLKGRVKKRTITKDIEGRILKSKKKESYVVTADDYKFLMKNENVSLFWNSKYGYKQFRNSNGRFISKSL